MDVKAAVLNGKGKSKVYVKDSQGHKDGVLKIKKAIYGLRKRHRAWC